MTADEVKDAHDRIWDADHNSMNTFRLHAIVIVDSLYLIDLKHNEYAIRIIWSDRGKRGIKITRNVFKHKAEVNQFLREL